MIKQSNLNAKEFISQGNITMNEKEIIQLLEKVPPLWDLESYIAVNPFLGYTDRHFEDAMKHLEGLLDTSLVPDTELLDGKKMIPKLSSKKNLGYKLEALLGAFLTSYTDKGISFWTNPWKHLPLWEAFKNWSKKDPLFAQLAEKEAYKELEQLPADAIQSIIALTQKSGRLNPTSLESVLFLMAGWASYFRKKNWHEPFQSNSDLPCFMAILSFLYVHIPTLFPEQEVHYAAGYESRVKNLKKKEKEYRDGLLNNIQKKIKIGESKKKTAKVRFLFCIDVRSESMRRHLESVSDEIETDGFAGFFGMPIGYKYWTNEEFSHSPALIQPAFVFKHNNSDSKKKLLETKSWVQKIKRTFPIGFQYVEVAGFLSAFGLLAKTLKKVTNSNQHRKLSDEDVQNAVYSLGPENQNAIALGILKHLGWTENFPEYVVITGHGSHTENNPHEAGLSCGACSGQSGELSARFACELLNQSSVREYLRYENIAIPDSCKFIPAMHETVTDEIILFQKENLDKSFLPTLTEWIQKAKQANRLEKQMIMGLNPKTAEARSKDWAEVFPEAGLAGCAALIIGRRELTYGLDLKGRTFLNTYDYKKDYELKTLELLLTAPMVVASWINLQYYASTVSPEKYGAGNKLLHSITGNLGVLEGNSWSLRTGLPLQSVYDGEKFIHQPIRLQVVVESPLANVKEILSKHESVNRLVDGEWIYLIIVDPNQGFMVRKNNTWVKWEGGKA